MPQIRLRLPHRFEPRSYHRRVYAAWERGIRHFLLVMHRRSGKTKGLINLMPKAMLARTGNYAHVFPLLGQACDVVWKGIDHQGMLYRDHFPAPLLWKLNESELMLTLRNPKNLNEGGSTYKLYGTDKNHNALVGGNFAGIIWDEWSLQNPLARDYTRPILAENGGWEAVCLTPRGENHAHDLYRAVKDDPLWHVEYLTVDDTRRDAKGEDGAPIITAETIELERREMVMRGEPNADAMIEQEYYLSWKSPMPGAYYAKELTDAQRDGRIGKVLYDPARPVDTYWDLGTSKAHDTNTIWFAQYQGNAVLVIDYYQASNQGVAHFAQMIQERGYHYRAHYATQPDLDESDWGTGKSRIEQAKAHGLVFTGVPKLPLVDGINAVRALLPRCYFDADKCRLGLNGLRSYRRKWDTAKRIFLDHPEHDWASHPADAFRYLAVGASTDWNGERAQRKPRSQRAYSGGGGWMA